MSGGLVVVLMFFENLFKGDSGSNAVLEIVEAEGDGGMG
jgi:hypothetical protein